MKVWILFEQDWDTPEVIGVYTNKELAEDAMAERVAKLGRAPLYDVWVIKEFELQGDLNVNN